MKLDLDQLDFDRCEDEPIHIPESIQGYGYLFALDEHSSEIKLVSDNISTLLRLNNDVIGTDFFELLELDDDDRQFIQETYERARDRQTRLPLKIRFKSEVLAENSRADFYAVLYTSSPYRVMEIEPASKFRQSYSARHYIKLYTMNVAPKFKMYKSLRTMAQEIVDTIHYITEMDRVVLYRFNQDGTGKVIAEHKRDDMESYLDLCYPASDIPSQAQELYKINWVRLTPNVDLPSSKLIPTIADSDRGVSRVSARHCPAGYWSTRPRRLRTLQTTCRPTWMPKYGVFLPIGLGQRRSLSKGSRRWVCRTFC